MAPHPSRQHQAARFSAGAFSRRERDALADSLRAVGADGRTLCEGWSARDLATHLVVREGKPYLMPAGAVPFLKGWAGRVQHSVAEQPFEHIVTTFQQGPPLLSPYSVPGLDALANSAEHFVHHEDVRRAQPEWHPRALDPEREKALLPTLRTMARLLLRRAPVGIRMAPVGHSPFRLKGGTPTVTIVGTVDELVLYAFGRRSVARVEIQGGAAAQAALATTDVSI